MIICPICGNENPEGSQFCRVCKVEFQTLPKDIYPPERVSGGNEDNREMLPKSVNDQELDLNQSIPDWLRDCINHKSKQGQNSEKMNFDDYSNILFGIPPLEKSASPEKVLTPEKTEKRKKSIYQPSLESTVEAPLMEEDENQKSVPPDYPVLHDFNTVRPVKKWDDPVEDRRIEAVRSQVQKEFAPVSDIPALWLEDAPLVEEDGDNAKGAGYDSEFANSVSPTKVIGSEETSGMAQNAQFTAAAVSDEQESMQEDADEFHPESGSLLSDLMNEINSNAGMPAPVETAANDQGTVFFSGSGDRDNAENAEPELPDISSDSGASGGSAAVLDQILRRIGYSVEKESGDSAAEVSSDPGPGSTVGAMESKNETDPALIIEPDEDAEGNRAPGLGFEPEPALGLELDPPLIESNDPADTTGKNASDEYDPDEEPDDTEIPWDLFGSADMTLTQASDEPGYRTFSRTGIPEEDSKAETYQQRMLSSVLGRIIQAENFVPPEKKINARAISIWARIFWSILAIAGVVLILTSEISSKNPILASVQSEYTTAFWQAAEETRGSALIVIDYTPSYGEVLDAQAEELIETLSRNTDELFLGALNPAAMTTVQKLLGKYSDQVKFAGWWPAGVISIRARLAEGSIPDQVWLITAEIGSVRSWAEQLSVMEEAPALYIMSPGQLRPLLSSYLNSEMLTGISCEDQKPGGIDEEGKNRLAVFFLAALLPLAWLAGVGGGFLKTDPDFRRKKNDSLTEEVRSRPEKEAEDA